MGNSKSQIQPKTELGNRPYQYGSKFIIFHLYPTQIDPKHHMPMFCLTAKTPEGACRFLESTCGGSGGIVDHAILNHSASIMSKDAIETASNSLLRLSEYELEFLSSCNS